MKVGGKGRGGGTDICGARAGLGEKKGSIQADSDWSPTVDDIRAGTAGVTNVYCLREVQYDRGAVGTKGPLERQGRPVGSRDRQPGSGARCRVYLEIS